MLPSRVFRDFSMEDLLGKEVMEGLMTTEEELERNKGGKTWLLLKVHVLAVAKLRDALVKLVSQGQALELHLEDLHHQEVNAKVSFSVKNMS